MSIFGKPPFKPPIAAVPPRPPTPEPEVYAEFLVTYLTEKINMDPAARHQRATGLVTWAVYAKNAEDAIRRLREQEPMHEPVIEIASVQHTGKDTQRLMVPIEWGSHDTFNGGPNGSLIHSN